MDIQAEKLHLIEQLTRLQDVGIIMRIKKLLQNTAKEKDKLLKDSIDRGVRQSKAGQTHPHQEVMAEMRAKHGT